MRPSRRRPEAIEPNGVAAGSRAIDLRPKLLLITAEFLKYIIERIRMAGSPGHLDSRAYPVA